MTLNEIPTHDITTKNTINRYIIHKSRTDDTYYFGEENKQNPSSDVFGFYLT